MNGKLKHQIIWSNSKKQKGACSPTNEVVPHLLQHWLHVLSRQTLGAHQTLQHPKHPPKTTTEW